MSGVSRDTPDARPKVLKAPATAASEDLSALPRLEDEARRILQASSEKKVVLRLIGGVAIAMRCPSASREGLRRGYVDMDLVGHEKQSKAIKNFFAQMEYQPRERFNAMMGRKRLIFNDLVNQRRVDIFLDVFEMSHRFDFAERIELEALTLPLADLLVTKLQIVQINDKDLRDMATLIMDHDVGSADGETINASYMARLCSNDWGVYKTFTSNLSKLEAYLDGYGLSSSEIDRVRARIRRLADLIEKEPKSLAWRLRARVGERKTWYELPEPDRAVVAGSFG